MLLWPSRKLEAFERARNRVRRSERTVRDARRLMPARLTQGPPIDVESAATHEAACDFNEELTVQVLTPCLGRIIDALAKA